MKILTDRQYEGRINKARREREDELYRNKQIDELRHKIYELEKRVSSLEYMLKYGHEEPKPMAVCNHVEG